MLELDIDTFIVILRKIENNHKDFQLTHKEIKVYVDCIHNSWESLYIHIQTAEDDLLQEIKFLLASLRTSLSHEKRSFIAGRAIKILRNLRYVKKHSEGFSPDNF
jgi:hypothetical protein